jgi:hypothetical protein
VDAQRAGEAVCGSTKQKGGDNVKSNSAGKFILALRIFTQEATEINVKYFQSKIVVNIKNQNVFQI